MNRPDIDQGHFVAIFGSGIAGAEAAFQLSKRGIYSVLFEQHALPYGKIEEGLPKWHVKLRNQEEQKIDQKLTMPGVFYVPKTKFGKDLTLADVGKWGFSAVLLAVGAWNDRPLPVPGIDDFIGRGFYYQNSFVSWFNHNHEKNYDGTSCEISDNAIVIGGGLASIDVAKILMLETTRMALEKRGIPADLFSLERDGIPETLKQHKLNFRQLGLKGCVLFYRRRLIDMPLTPIPDNADKNRLEKVFLLRKRILDNFLNKYLFRVEECHNPVDKIVENGRLRGIVFQKSQIRDGKLYPAGDFVWVRSPLVISSIGSIPEPISEIPVEGDMLSIEDPVSGRIEGYDNIFAVGNAVTGRGNIRESLTHSRETTRQIVRNYLNREDERFSEYVRRREQHTAGTVNRMADSLVMSPLLSRDKISHILMKIQKRQEKVGYSGNYSQWIQEKRPIRLEELD